VVVHDVLETLLGRPPRNPIYKALWFPYILKYCNTPKINYIVLGPSLEENLLQLTPALKGYVHSIDMPYFFEPASDFTPCRDGTLRFGSIGIGHKTKGTHLLFELAQHFKSVHSRYQASFQHIGGISEAILLDAGNQNAVTVYAGGNSLKREDFEKALREIDYAVFFYPSDSYKLRASGAIFDALSFQKPVIAIRNSYFGYCFDAMGDIGYLCSDYSEMLATIDDILNNWDLCRYALQQKNIRTGRERFGLNETAGRIGNIIKSRK